MPDDVRAMLDELEAFVASDREISIADAAMVLRRLPTLLRLARRWLEAGKELQNIANAKPETWDDPTDFQAWAQSRARHALARLAEKEER